MHTCFFKITKLPYIQLLTDFNIYSDTEFKRRTYVCVVYRRTLLGDRCHIPGQIAEAYQGISVELLELNNLSLTLPLFLCVYMCVCV